jgi:hypothetical protein
VIVRAVAPAELDRFVEFTDDRDQVEQLRAHLEEALASGATGTDWCLVCEVEERWLGRLLLRAPAGIGQIFIHFLDVC